MRPGSQADVSVLLTGDDAIRTLNRKYRRKDQATDVLSFPAVDGAAIAGDLAHLARDGIPASAEHGHMLEMEIKVLLLHGLLHLAGYDHEADDGKCTARRNVCDASLD